MTTIQQLFDLSGQRAIVTGAAQGIGQAIALRLAEAGAHVLVAGHNDAGLQQTAATIRGSGGTAAVQVTDMTRMTDLDALVQKAGDEFGGIDLLVNAAGGAHPFTPALEISEELWDKTHDRNLKGCFFLSQKVARVMIAAGNGGRIIHIGSIAALRPDPLLSDYSAAKAGVTMLTKSLAQEFGQHRVLVNAVLPGPINTPNTAHFYATAEVQQIVRERTPLGCVGEADDIANAALFLASGAARHITGAVLVVDGGMTTF